MHRKSSTDSGSFRPRIFLAFLFGSTGIALAVASFTGASWLPLAVKEIRQAAPPRYMPVPGGEADDLDRLESVWNDRLTYPTGRFDPLWVRLAAAQDSLIPSNIPAGVPLNLKASLSPLALDPAKFTSLGPKPLRMTGCSGCFDYNFATGRINDIVIDPTTTTNGSIVVYAASVGGGVWKTTNCCSTDTTWNVVTDDPLLATVSVDTLTIDPNNHNTIYAGTGDLNYGSFSMGSQGILKSTDAGATWTLLGGDVFGPSLFFEAGKFPQYQAVGKVRVDPNNSNNVVAGTKTGLYFSYNGGTSWSGPCRTNSFTTMRQDITGLHLIDNGTTTSIIAAVGVRGFSTTVQYNLNQNGANGIYKGTLPANGCPTDFVPISTDLTGWAGQNAASGMAYVNATAGNQLGRIDIAVAPSNPNYIYAQVQAITPNPNLASCGNAPGCQLGAYRTIDGGATWTLIPGSPGAALTDCDGAPGDYPQNWYDQGVAVDPNNPDRAFFDTFEIWSWGLGQTAWNDTTCGYGLLSNNGVHVDQHALAYVPGSSDILVVGNDGGIHATTNASVTFTTAGATDPTWFDMNKGLNTIEFYSGDISGNFATSPEPQANGGAQDNGSMSVKFTGAPTGPVQWQMGKGGDGFYARIDPVGTGTNLRFWQGNNNGTLNRCVSNCTQPNASWSTRSGGWGTEQQSFILPYDLFHGGIPGGDDCDPAGLTTGCGRLIAGTTRVWETITGATGTNTWYITNNPPGSPTGPNLTKGRLGNRSFINQVKYSPKYHSVAIVGTNDGNVQIGFNLGTGVASQAVWVDVTDDNAILPDRPVLGIALDPSVAAANTPIGYAAVGGFNANTPTTPGHVFRVVCNANCATPIWENKSGNLPDIPVDSIIVNPNIPKQVFAGTDWGLYYTDDITAVSPTWSRFDNGLPHTMIWDMQIDRGATTLSVWTRGRGAYVWPLPASGSPSPTPTPTPTPTPAPTPTPTPTPTPSPTPSPTPTPTPTPTPAQLLNISTRARVLTGDNNLIGGFIINGNVNKRVVVLAKGPSMTSGGSPVPGRMANPTLALHNGDGVLITNNDDWKDSPERGQIEASGLAPSDDKEAAILRSLPPGVYTGVLTGKDNTTGIGLIEAYDLDANVDSLLANISSRGLVDTGDNVMIGGFIAGNQSGNTSVLVRGIGPSLQGKVPNPLADPILELHDSNGATLETNDNWKDSPNRSEIEATGIQPTDDQESAIIRSVAPNGYTAILRGKTGSGIALVEIYNIR